MKRFLISYAFTLDAALEPAWRAAVAAFVAALEADPELRGRIAYRAMRSADGRYHHLAEPADDAAADLLATRAWFEQYNAELRRVAGGAVTVAPLETIAITSTS